MKNKTKEGIATVVKPDERLILIFEEPLTEGEYTYIRKALEDKHTDIVIGGRNCKVVVTHKDAETDVGFEVIK